MATQKNMFDSVQSVRAILVDDEERARDVLDNLLKRFCPEVEVVAKCRHLEEAVDVIRIHQPNLVFLDIEMPNYAGFEIVRFFSEVTFEIIFVTAYDQYAIRAFEIAALDYLLKPIDIERLKSAVGRARQHLNLEHQSQRLELLSNTLETRHLKNLIVVEKGQQHVVALESLIAIEAQESYCLLYTAGRRYMASKNLRHYEELLCSQPPFIRTHKSWIINSRFLLHYSKSELTLELEGNITARLSKYKKAEFEDMIR